MARRAALALAVLLALPGAAAAQRSLEFPSFATRIEVQRDGMLEVTETIEARFTGQWNGIYRTIPLRYRGAAGLDWTVGISLIEVTDGAGNTLPTEVQHPGHRIKFKIRVPGAHDATRLVVVRYRVRNGLRYFDEHDELYWNLTGDEWDVALGQVSAEILLPDGATGVRATAFNGPHGATLQEAGVTIAGTRVSVRMPRPLAFREGVTAVVGWDKGLVAEPGPLTRAGWFLRSNWPLLVPLLVLALMLRLWWRRGRDPRTRPIAVQYEPPGGLTPAEAGTLTDEQVDLRDITATVVSLAVRGWLRIEEREEKALFGLISREEFHFHLLKPRDQWGELAPHEQRVLGGIFEGGKEEVALSDLKDEFYTHLDGIKDAVFDSLIARKLIRVRPDTTRAKWVVGGIALGFALGIAGSILSARTGISGFATFLGALLSGLVVVIVGWNMPARTEAGVRALEGVLGFGEFLERVEGPRFSAIERTPELFERFLPYAMAFGVEQKWARGFEGLLSRPPTWYTGSNLSGFNARSFSRQLSTMSDRTASTMSSSPRSSSGSGFSGGGSSGGGGGGGGGGGW